jgi:peptide/nickel transport system ATP-binding protein
VTVLEVTGLSVTFPTSDGDVRAVRDVSLRLEPGETIGIVGESGSGKSTIALAALGLLPRGTRVSGSVRCADRELLGLPETELAKVRGQTLAYIPQDPLTSLNPAFPVGWQVAETLWTRGRLSKAAAQERAVELLDLVGIPHAARRAGDYPHEFSGGMRQRVVIAIAMACDPDVMIADEPTTALDVTIQAQVLEALRDARDRTAASLLLITHDLGVVAGMADRVMVMYAGKLVESGPADAVFYRSRMPYTLGLLGSLPRLDAAGGGRLRPIPGSPPSLIDLPAGCPFAPRCPAVVDECLGTEPPLAPVETGHAVACHRASSLPAELLAAPNTGPAADIDVAGERAAGITMAGKSMAEKAAADSGAGVDGAGPLVCVRDLVKHFPVRGGRLVRRQIATAHAVDGVSFELDGGETLGLVGESGCGKSTTARAVLQLLPVTSGSVRYGGAELTGKSRRELRTYRQHLQVVFQDPFASLDPRMPVGEIVAEPLRVHGRWGRGSGPARVDELFAMVGLNPEHRNRYPHEFSGGQRQRVGIARALALRPRVLVLDEPVSALDVSIQAGIVNLLEELQERLGLAYLFIAHDLSVVRHICDRVAVMYLGRIVETGSAAAVYASPSHPYTQALLSAVPVPDPVVERRRRRILLAGDVPSAVDPPSGCRFRTRCWKAQDICASEVPALTERGQGHPVACHFADAAPVLSPLRGAGRQERPQLRRAGEHVPGYPERPRRCHVVRAVVGEDRFFRGDLQLGEGMLEDHRVGLDDVELAADEERLEEVAERAEPHVAAEVRAGVGEHREPGAAGLEVGDHLDRAGVDADPAAEVGRPQLVHARVVPVGADVGRDRPPVGAHAAVALVKTVPVGLVGRPEFAGARVPHTGEPFDLGPVGRGLGE